MRTLYSSSVQICEAFDCKRSSGEQRRRLDAADPRGQGVRPCSRTPPRTRSRSCCATARTIAVVGLSADPTRPSHGVARALQRFGYRIIPVTPDRRGRSSASPRCASLEQLPEVLGADERVDIVDVFRRPEHVPRIVADCIRLEAPGAVAAGRRDRRDRRPSAPARGHLHRDGPLPVPGPRGAALDGAHTAGALARQGLYAILRAAMRIAFTKMHGVGNDFVVFDAPARARCSRPTGCARSPTAAPASASTRRWSCEPARRAGQRRLLPDLQLRRRRGRAVRQRRALHRRAPAPPRRARAGALVTLDSPAGPGAARVSRRRRGLASTWACPTSIRASLPFEAPAEADRYPLEVAGRTLEIGAVSIGNPHAVLTVESVDAAPGRARWVRRSSAIRASRGG